MAGTRQTFFFFRLDRVPFPTSLVSVPPSPILFNRNDWLYLVLILDHIFYFGIWNIDTCSLCHSELIFSHSVTYSGRIGKQKGRIFLPRCLLIRQEKRSEPPHLSGPQFFCLSNKNDNTDCKGPLGRSQEIT